MKKFILGFLILIVLLIAGIADAAPSNRVYWANCYVGGTAGCLDKINSLKSDGSARFTDGDIAVLAIKANDANYPSVRDLFTWDDDSGCTEETSPAVITCVDPDDQTGSGRWVKTHFSGDMGIGTSAPAAKLHVDGPKMLLEHSTQARIQIKRKVAAVANGYVEWIGNDDVVDWQIAVNQEGANHFGIYEGDATNPRLHIYNGNVGIGTVTPSEKLEVNGNVKVSGDIVAGAHNISKEKKSVTVLSPLVSDSNMVQIQLSDTATTITRVSCSTEDADTVGVQFDERTEITPNTAGTDILASTLVCDNDSEITTSFSNASIAANAVLNLQLISGSGTPDVARIHIEFTYD